MSKSFDPVALEYDFAAEIHNNNEFFLARLPKSRGSVLDIGCGSGILAYALSDCFDQVYGIDISDGMLEIAKNRRCKPSINYLHMNAENIDIEKTFDYIVSRTTLHHIKDKDALLVKMKSMLNDNGKIVIIDNVSKVPTPKRYLNVIGAHLDFISNVKAYGYRVAKRLYKHCISADWLNHLNSDVYLSEAETTALYNKHFPGCRFTRFACFMGMEWHKKVSHE